MAARSAMGFAAGALRQTVAAQARVAPSVVPRTIGQQTRSMGGASHSPSTAPRSLHRADPAFGPRHPARAPRWTHPIIARLFLFSRAGRTEDARILHASGPSFAARGSPPNLRVGRTGPPESRPCLLPSTPPPTLASRALTFHPSPLISSFATGQGSGVTYEGLTLHEPGAFHKAWAYGLGGLCWFWVFYRFYKDGDTLIYGHAPHFEHDDDDDHH